MRHVFIAIAAASFLFGFVPSVSAQNATCKVTTVPSGTSVTGSDGYKTSCCQCFTGGTCQMQICRIGYRSYNNRTIYQFKRSLISQSCTGSCVK